MKKRQFVDFWRNLPIFGKKTPPIWRFPVKNVKITIYLSFSAIFGPKIAKLAIFGEKSPNWRFL